jgi:hypothetical protein
MASNTTPKFRYLFVCTRRPACGAKPTTDPQAARAHYLEKRHPYETHPLPPEVHFERECAAAEAAGLGIPLSPLKLAVAPLPESPQPESIEARLQLLQGLFERTEEVADALAKEVREDRRFTSSSPNWEHADWFEVLALDAAGNKLDVADFLKELAQTGAPQQSAEVANG